MKVTRLAFFFWENAPQTDESSSKDEIPERDVTYHLLRLAYLFTTELPHVLPEYVLNDAILLHI